MKIEFPSREFDDAVAAVCHGLVSDEQADALNELLRRNAAARDEYLLRLELHSRLASQLDLFASAVTDGRGQEAGGGLLFPSGEGSRASSGVATKRKIIRSLSLAAGLVLLAAIGWKWQRRNLPPTSESPVFAAAESGWRPSSANLPGQEYPRLNSEGRAQFRIRAPQAKDVAVNIGHPLTVTKTDDGVWTITTEPLGIGFHFYQLVVDGRKETDPATPIFRGGGGDFISSAIEVPTGDDFHERKNVPHGEVREQRYFSGTTNDWRRIFVYTPPDYHANPSARFPVLYLLPGAGEDETCWSAQGRVSQILDNLIAEKNAKPMLVVMGGGTAQRPGERDTTSRPPADWNRRFSTLDEVFMSDLIPFIDGTYRTLATGDHRAIAGLSLGGAQAFAIGLTHPDRFAHVGGFSGVGGGPGRNLDFMTAYGGVMADADTFNRKMRLLFVSVGGDEPDWMLNSITRYHEALSAMGIKHVFYTSPETAHEWHTWRRSLREFAPLLFKD
ncbi:MAG TPA: alpha/beta hydrolase-fold protein [Opitutaceae bacterium]|nr:alpha/beta hydrolase-fold protein [Opitutaceae bacterium]